MTKRIKNVKRKNGRYGGKDIYILYLKHILKSFNIYIYI